MSLVVWTHPMKLPSCANLREHWGKRSSRARDHRRVGFLKTRDALWGNSYALPVVVLLVRYGVRDLDSDNLASAFKALRDGIADALGMDDGDKRITWLYEQTRCKRGEEAVRIHLRCGSASNQENRVKLVAMPERKASSRAPTATRKTNGKASRNMGVGE